MSETCGSDHVDAASQSSDGALAAVGVAAALCYGFLVWGTYRSCKRRAAWPLALPIVYGVVATCLYAWNLQSQDVVSIFLGNNPADGSTLHLPVLEVGCHPEDLGDEYIEDIRLRYVCNKNSKWRWNGEEYNLRCAGEEQDSSESEAAGGTGSPNGKVKERGNSRFPVRMGMTIKFEEKIQLAGHHFKDTKYRIAGARYDPLRMGDPLLQELWFGMTNTEGSGTGIACTNVHMFMKKDYMGIFSVCSDRDDKNAVAGKADWIVETLPDGMEVEHAPDDAAGDELCKGQGVQPYPESPQCPEVRPFVKRVEDDPLAVANYADQFIMGEIMRDVDGYHRSTFVHIKDNAVLFGPQWDCDLCFKFHQQGYKGWYYKVDHWPGKVLSWAEDPRPKASEIKARYMQLRAAGGPLSNAAVEATFAKISAGMHDDAHYDEEVWTRPLVRARDFGTPDSLAVYGMQTIGAFSGEFDLLKRLTLSRLCWIEKHIDDLKDGSGPAVQFKVGWASYFAMLSWPAAGFAVLALCVQGARKLCDREDGYAKL